MKFLWIILSAWALAIPAQAFTCSRVGDTGPSLSWRVSTVPFVVYEADVPDVDAEEVIGAMSWSFSQWSAACANFEFTFGGVPTTGRDRAGFDWVAGRGNAPNENLLVFRSAGGNEADRWLHNGSFVALTTVTFEAATGEILDADIEMNNTGAGFDDCDPGCTAHDLRSTLTHEMGHALGLDHSADAQATMQASTAIADTQKRDLNNDDIEGLCAIYPINSAGPADCFGLSPVDPSVTITQSCASQGVGSQSAPPSLLALLVLAMFWRGRRRSS